MPNSLEKLKNEGEDFAASGLCAITVVGVSVGVLGMAGKLPGLLVGAIVGILAATKLCGKGQIGNKFYKEKLKDRANPKLSSSELGAYLNTMKSEYNVSEQDAIFLEQVASHYIRKGGIVPETTPSKGRVIRGIEIILKRRPLGREVRA